MKMIKLRKAQIDESEDILEFYRNIIFSIENSEFKPEWSDAYPDLEFIENSILNETMYVYSSDNGIDACVVVNNEFGEGYDDVKWHVNAEASQIIVIHAFAVNSKGKGIGREILNQIEKTAIKNNRKTMRIDIIDGNEGARKVFESLGFEYVDSVEAFHDAVGLKTFHLYEKILKSG